MTTAPPFAPRAPAAKPMPLAPSAKEPPAPKQRILGEQHLGQHAMGSAPSPPERPVVDRKR